MQILDVIMERTFRPAGQSNASVGKKLFIKNKAGKPGKTVKTGNDSILHRYQSEIQTQQERRKGVETEG